MSSYWDRERARGGEDRRRVEQRARRWRASSRRGSWLRGRSMRRVLTSVERGFRTVRSRLSARGRAVSRVVLSAPGRRARERREAALRTLLAASPPGQPNANVACVIVGHREGPAERAARRAGCSPIVVTGPQTNRNGQTNQNAEGPKELVCFMAATTEPLSDSWLTMLVSAIHDGAVAAAPTLVRPRYDALHSTPRDGSVLAAGLDLVLDEAGAPVLRARDAHQVPYPEARTEEVAAVSGACLLVDRRAMEEVGGFDPMIDPDMAAIDLCIRLRDAGGKVVVARSAFAIAAFSTDDGGWRTVVERDGPTLWRQAARVPIDNGRLRFAITIAAPSEKLAPRWGDWHLAGGLARALERSGHATRVQTLDHAESLAGRACDLHLVLRGRQPVRRTRGQRHVLWIISHPETVDVAECDEADLVLVASERFAADLRARTTTPVEVLLQATDQHRFRPLPPVPRHLHPVAVVAKTRDAARPIVMDAIAAGLRPAIYGTGWEAFVDPALVVAPYVPNEELPAVYSSVGVLLNDHWPTMREWGFVSNRLFDALACGTSVISDHLPELEQLFGDEVSTYQDVDDLRELVQKILRSATDNPSAVARRRELVLAGHTFDARAASLLDFLVRHALSTRTAS